MLKIATDCSGIGSPEQALKELGIEHKVVFMCEKDKYAQQTWRANHVADHYFDDMTTRDNSPPELYADVYAAGIPCQSFSLAGKRLGELDKRGLLFYNAYDYIDKQRPKAFVIENVKGLLSDKKGQTFRNWLELLANTINYQEQLHPHPDTLGYHVHYTVLNTKDFGLPQNRERVFIVGIRADLPNTFRFPLGWPLTTKLKDVLEPLVDEKYYLSDKMLNYFNTRKDNFNAGKLNLKLGDDVASTITSSSSSLDISDNLIVCNDNGTLRETDTVNCIDANYHKGIDNHAQRSMIIETKNPEPKINIVGETTANSQAGKVYDPDGLFPTICAGTHGVAMGSVIEVKDQEKTQLSDRIVGRNLDNPKSREKGIELDQMLELNDNTDITSTLTTVQKDNVILEVIQINPSLESGGQQPYQQNRRYDFAGLVPALMRDKADLLIKTDESEVNFQSPYSNCRIRRLTPLECFRLQGFPDSFVKPVSDTQLYRQAGNTITVTVIKNILKNLLPIIS